MPPAACCPMPAAWLHPTPRSHVIALPAPHALFPTQEEEPEDEELDSDEEEEGGPGSSHKRKRLEEEGARGQPCALVTGHGVKRAVLNAEPALNASIAWRACVPQRRRRTTTSEHGLGLATNEPRVLVWPGGRARHVDMWPCAQVQRHARQHSTGITLSISHVNSAIA